MSFPTLNPNVGYGAVALRQPPSVQTMGAANPTMGNINGAMVPHGLLPHDTRLHPAANPAGLYGFQGMMDEYPPGFGPPPPREPTPPPPVERLAGYRDEAVVGLQEIKEEKLVYGQGAKRDASGVLGMGLPKLNTEQALLVQKAKKYAMEVSIKMVLMKQTLAHQQQQTKYLERQQAVAIMSRIYVGGVNYDTREDQIKTAFLTFGPVRSITMSWDSMTGKHKGFAFVEFDQPEAAQLALDQMNGINVCGKAVKVGWPSQMPQAQARIDEIRKEAQNFNRIYVAGIHKDLGDDDIRTVFSAFGPIASCELASAGLPGRHKGYGYIEYETLQSTQEAISSMNLFDLGGQLLRVGRAVAPPGVLNQQGAAGAPKPMPSASAVAAAAATAKIQAMDAVATNLGVSASDLGMKEPGLPVRGVDGAPAQPQNTDWRERQIRKCGLPRDEFGNPIKANSQLGPNAVQCGPKRIPGVNDESPPRRGGGRSPPRRSRDRDSRGRDSWDSRDSRGRSKSQERGRSGPRETLQKEALREAHRREEGGAEQPPPPPALLQAPLQLAAPEPRAPLEDSFVPAGPMHKLAQGGIGEVQEKSAQLVMEKGLQDEANQEPVTLKQQEDLQIRGKSARQMVMQKLMGARGKVDSVVLLLKNMVGPEEVDEDLHDEIQQECGKYGKVENVVIYQEKQDDTEDAEVHVKIFVEFHESIETKKAKNALDGRFFGGRTVAALIYDQELYDQQDFSA